MQITITAMMLRSKSVCSNCCPELPCPLSSRCAIWSSDKHTKLVSISWGMTWWTLLIVQRSKWRGPDGISQWIRGACKKFRAIWIWFRIHRLHKLRLYETVGSLGKIWWAYGVWTSAHCRKKATKDLKDRWELKSPLAAVIPVYVCNFAILVNTKGMYSWMYC